MRPDLTLRAGLRDEYYQGATTPGLNPRFLAQYGFPNTATFNGMNILMPRVGFNWRPDPSLSVTGGFGLFSGGSPNVWLSNSFTNTGNLLGSVTCLPTQAANPTLASPTACASALQGVTGTSVGQAAQTANTNSTLAGIGIVNAVDPHFHPPSTWKASLSVVKEFDLPYVGPGWRAHADYLYEKVQDGVTWVDLWAQQNPGAPAPDGRETYNVARFTNALGRNTGYDLMLTNDHGGGGSVIAVGLANAWRDGWLKGVDFDLTYTHEDIKEVNPGTSSVALSNYSQWATADRNQPDVGVSNYNIKDQVKFILGYRRAFFGDYNTSIQFMLDRRSGLPYSFTFDQTSSPGGTGSLSSGAASTTCSASPARWPTATPSCSMCRPPTPAATSPGPAIQGDLRARLRHRRLQRLPQTDRSDQIRRGNLTEERLHLARRDLRQHAPQPGVAGLLPRRRQVHRVYGSDQYRQYDQSALGRARTIRLPLCVAQCHGQELSSHRADVQRPYRNLRIGSGQLLRVRQLHPAEQRGQERFQQPDLRLCPRAGRSSSA